MISEVKQPTVYGTMSYILFNLNSQENKKDLGRNLAVLRNSTGKPLEEASEVWALVFPLLPAEYLGSGALTREEKALITALQLYAIGQQGVSKTRDDGSSGSFGKSLRRIRTKDSGSALDKRFNAMLTATTFDEFSYHLRQIFKSGKSNSSFTVNFPALASDLFWYQSGKSGQVCLRWASDYYRAENTGAETASDPAEKE